MQNTLEGKKLAYLLGLKSLAAIRPREATHLTKLLFDKGDLLTRLATLKTTIFSDHVGNGHLVGDFFVRLMGATTAEERKDIVDPFFKRLFQQSTLSKMAQGKLAWLQAYYHGWQAESVPGSAPSKISKYF